MMTLEWQNLIQMVIKIAHRETGIQLSEQNYSMIQARLTKRIHTINLKTPIEYMDYILKNEIDETKHLISIITTHFTSFFREYVHFEEIEKKYIQKIVASKGDNDNTIRILSAACSQGQECYSLSMFFHNLKLQNLLHNKNYVILGMDVDQESVKYANNGVYYYNDLMQSPLIYIKGNWRRGKNEIRDFVKPKDHIRKPIFFQNGNLLSNNAIKTKNKFDIIFCRNVLIYFSHEQVVTIINNLLNHLTPNGLLILGLSESVYGYDLPVKLLSNNIYHFDKCTLYSEKEKINKIAAEKRLWKIMCVDDSPTIIALLKRILTKEFGFEVVATASSAKEAREKLRTTKIDLMTLDIQMDQETGLEYLKSDFNIKTHPPVVIVSSHERDGNEIPKLALQYGASDYIEKPTMNDFQKSNDEIRFKIKTILENKIKLTDLTKPDPNINKIKILIADSSYSSIKELRSAFDKISDLYVVGEFEDARQIENFIETNKTDVLVLDINMPFIFDKNLIHTLLNKYQVQTILMTSVGFVEGKRVIDGLEQGAFDYFQKPTMGQFENHASELIEKILLANKSKLRTNRQKNIKIKSISKNLDMDYLIAIGASTGGTEAIKEVLENLPNNIPPILIVQHIPAVFSQAFAERLNNIVPFNVVEAQHNQILENNFVYVAPGDKHMELLKLENKNLKIVLSDKAKCNGHRPSVDILFNSISKCKLPKLVGVLMTGMGSDGALGLKNIRDNGGVTIAQDEESSVVFGMPKEAIKLNAASFIEPLNSIADRIENLIRSK